jgi:hypothetical protein
MSGGTHPFTKTEQAEILRYLGYADWQDLAQSFQLGLPADSQPEFLVREGFDRISPEARALVRRDVCELRDIELQRSQARRRAVATKVGDLMVDTREEIKILNAERTYWTNKLANDMGNVYYNLWAADRVGGYSQRNRRTYFD